MGHLEYLGVMAFLLNRRFENSIAFLAYKQIVEKIIAYGIDTIVDIQSIICKYSKAVYMVTDFGECLKRECS